MEAIQKEILFTQFLLETKSNELKLCHKIYSNLCYQFDLTSLKKNFDGQYYDGIDMNKKLVQLHLIKGNCQQIQYLLCEIKIQPIQSIIPILQLVKFKAGQYDIGATNIYKYSYITPKIYSQPLKNIQQKLENWQILSIVVKLQNLIDTLLKRGYRYHILQSSQILIIKNPIFIVNCTIQLTNLHNIKKIPHHANKSQQKKQSFRAVGLILSQMLQQKIKNKQIELQSISENSKIKTSIKELLKNQTKEYQRIFGHLLQTYLVSNKTEQQIRDTMLQTNKQMARIIQQIQSQRNNYISSQRAVDKIYQILNKNFYANYQNTLGTKQINFFQKNYQRKQQLAYSFNIQAFKHRNKKTNTTIFFGTCHTKKKKCALKQIQLIYQPGIINNKYFEREIQSFLKLQKFEEKHVNIIETYDILYFKKILLQPKEIKKDRNISQEIKIFENSFYFITERFENSKTLQIQDNNYSQKDLISIVQQIISGLKFLHEKIGLIHRDIKPKNIIVAKVENSYLVKLIDFGAANFIDNISKGLTRYLGTQGYMAPQVIKPDSQRPDQQYDSRCDCWSLGVVIYELLTGKRFLNDKNCQKLKPQQNQQILKKKSEQILNSIQLIVRERQNKQMWQFLLRGCLQYDFKQRLKIDQLQEYLSITFKNAKKQMNKNMQPSKNQIISFEKSKKIPLLLQKSIQTKNQSNSQSSFASNQFLIYQRQKQKYSKPLQSKKNMNILKSRFMTMPSKHFEIIPAINYELLIIKYVYNYLFNLKAHSFKSEMIIFCLISLQIVCILLSYSFQFFTLQSFTVILKNCFNANKIGQQKINRILNLKQLLNQKRKQQNLIDKEAQKIEQSISMGQQQQNQHQIYKSFLKQLKLTETIEKQYLLCIEIQKKLLSKTKFHQAHKFLQNQIRKLCE